MIGTSADLVERICLNQGRQVPTHCAYSKIMFTHVCNLILRHHDRYWDLRDLDLTSFKMSFNTTSFNQTLKSHWRSLSERLQADPKPVHIDGRGLDLAAVVVVAR